MRNLVLRGSFVLAIVLATVLAALIGGANRAWAANCSNTQLVPDVAELLVSQGAPGYSKLARGKEAVVRAYLRNPTNCTVTSKQAITPVSATLNVSYSSGDPAPLELRNFQPLSGKLLAATQVYSAADPFFVVPASYLAPQSTTGQFNVTFTFALKYTRTGSTSEFTTTTGSSTATATVNQKTNALRVLIVPMGDRSSTQVQWSSAAEATLNTIMTNTARALPVPTGAEGQLATVPFGATTAGIRYRISGDLLDIKALGLHTTVGGVTKFCANASSWKTVQLGATGVFAEKTLKTSLQERLDNYNLQNTPPADMVLGVIDGAIAWKSSDSGVICDDGRAATPDPLARTPGEVGWVRVDTGTYPTPLQMELAHTLGIAPTGSFHGAEVETDQGFTPSRADRGYNVLLGKVVATGTASGVVGTNDHSILNFDTASIPYTKDNTLAYFRDWDAALCDLGQSPLSCTISTAIGTDSGVAAGNDMYHIVGRVSPDFQVEDANTGEGNAERGTAVDEFGNIKPSRLHLLLCDGLCNTAVNKRDIPLSLSSQAPVDEDHTGAASSTDPDTFSALVSLTAPTLPSVSFTCAELWLDATPTTVISNSSVKKFTSACAGDPPPNVESVSTVAAGTVLRSFTPHSLICNVEFGCTQVDLCCNGRAVAFDGTHLYVTTAAASGAGNQNQHIYKVTTNGVIVESAFTGTTIGALGYNAATGHLYGGDYTLNEKVYEIDFDAETKTDLFTFTDDSVCEGQPDDTNAIDGLEYFLSGSEGRLALSGDICDTVFLKKLDGTAASPPSFATDNNSGITTDGANGFWLARLFFTGNTRLTHVASDGTVLSEFEISGYEAEDLAYDSVTFAPNCAVWMNEATFGEPTVQAVAVPCPDGNVQSGAKVKTTNADFVTLYAVCGTQTDAANTEVEKFSLGTYVPVNGETIVPFTDERFCANATIIAEASNSWATTGLTDTDADVGTGAPSQSPTVNIAAPLNGSVFRRGETIRYEGDAWDPEDGAIVAGLTWLDNGTVITAGTGKPSFDLAVASNAPLGEHTITLRASDSDPQTPDIETSVKINIKPKVCTTTAGC